MTLERLQKPWHIRIGVGSQAFIACPRSPRLKLILWLRGWRHTHYPWWTKLSRPS